MNKNFDEIIVTIYEEEWNDAVTESDPEFSGGSKWTKMIKDL